MTYRSLLVHADQSPGATARMQMAVRLALACQAHLTGIACSGVSRYAAADPARQWAPVAARLQQWHAQADASLAQLAALAGAAGLTAPSLRLLDTDPEDGLLQHAALGDLLVLSQSAPHAAAPGIIRDLPPELLLHSGRPLLLVPCQPDAPTGAPLPFAHPLLAWDGSRQAARAFSDALPLLKLASSVTLLVLNPAPASHGAEAGADMALWLARHAVPVSVMREYTRAAISDALLCVAGERRCDLLVMGGYGHMRARETLLGGTTRDVLRDMTLPVLVSH